MLPKRDDLRYLFWYLQFHFVYMADSMLVCMLIYNYRPERAGGAENQCRRLVAHLNSAGIQCIVLTGRHDIGVPSMEVDDRTLIFRLPTFETILQKFGIQKKSNSVQTNERNLDPRNHQHPVPHHQDPTKRYFSNIASFTLRYLNALIFGLSVLYFFYRKRATVSILHVHIADWLAGVAALSGRLLRIPVVCKGANQPVLPELKGIPFPTMLNHWRKRIFFIALTDSMKQDLLLNEVPSERIRVIPNGVMIPENIAAPEQHNSFLFVGNFSQTAAHKGFDILLYAWQDVVRKEPAARMIFAGGGDSRPWQSLAHQLGIEGSITFAGYQADLEDYYLSAACLVLPSRREGISNALLEAQSYGLPAIVSDIPGNREIVVDGVTGCIVPVGNSEFLTRAMLIIYRSPLLRKTYGKAARDRVVENFSMDSVALKVRGLYEDLLK